MVWKRTRKMRFVYRQESQGVDAADSVPSTTETVLVKGGRSSRVYWVLGLRSLKCSFRKRSPFGTDWWVWSSKRTNIWKYDGIIYDSDNFNLFLPSPTVSSSSVFDRGIKKDRIISLPSFLSLLPSLTCSFQSLTPNLYTSISKKYCSFTLLVYSPNYRTRLRVSPLV